MAEPGADIRRILLLAGVILVVTLSLVFFLFRGCVPGLVQKSKGYTTVYSNLDLKDAANVVARLKELSIPYEIKEEGRAVAVPKDKADQARLGLAEKNLPTGGAVGWEIFDVARMGATDFDRRIQLIRAISGELSRTIRRIEGVADARVQVVLPETRLFETTKVPVTASVMLRLHPGAELSQYQINGIVHLVASSVENLLPENVTVVDDTGRILTATKTASSLPPAPAPYGAGPAPAPYSVAPTSETVVATRETAVTQEVAATPLLTPEVSAEEKILLKVKAKREVESQLASKAQELLNRFYPPNSTIVRIEAALHPADGYRVNRITAVILIDNRVQLSARLKESTFAAVSGVIGYQRNRGDQIILRSVPFHLATIPPEVVKGQVEKMLPLPQKTAGSRFPFTFWALVIVIAGIVSFFLVRAFGRPAESAAPQTTFSTPPAIRREEPRESDLVSKIRNAAEINPERIASLLKSWLTE